MAYLRKNIEHLQAAFAENVGGLMVRRPGCAHSNLDIAIRDLQEAGFFVIVFVLCPSMFNKVASRRRVWILTIPRRLTQHVSDSVLNAKAKELLLSVMRSAQSSEQSFDLDYHLLPESDPVILKLLWRLAAEEPQKRCDKKSGWRRWAHQSCSACVCACASGSVCVCVCQLGFG